MTDATRICGSVTFSHAGRAVDRGLRSTSADAPPTLIAAELKVPVQPTPDRLVIERDIVPTFVVKNTSPVEPVSFEGTAFVIAPGVLVTCWHCVANEPPPEHGYAVVLDDGQGMFRAVPLSNMSQDPTGADLATANAPMEPTLNFRIPPGDVAYGVDVWTFGYPLTSRDPRNEGGFTFALAGRYLEGYVVRSFRYRHPSGRDIPSYELDMPAPGGLSGAPLVRTRSLEVVGVLYGSNDVGTIEEFAVVDPDTGHRTPEVQRIVSFGLAHYTDTLRQLRGTATGGKPLGEYLDEAREARESGS